MARPRVTAILTADLYRLMEQCVETGVAVGWRRAHKHEEHPSPESVREHIEREVMSEIAEWFRFPVA